MIHPPEQKAIGTGTWEYPPSSRLSSPPSPASLSRLRTPTLVRELRLPGRRLIVANGRSERFGTEAIIAFDMPRYDLRNSISRSRAGPILPHWTGLPFAAFDDFRVRFIPRTWQTSAAMRLTDAVFATRPGSGVLDALEAMDAGKPVIGWETADLAEIVEDKVTGLLVPLADRAALAASMRAILDNQSYARRLGEAGRARAAERFGRARMIEQFARLYRELAPPTGAD